MCTLPVSRPGKIGIRPRGLWDEWAVQICSTMGFFFFFSSIFMGVERERKRERERERESAVRVGYIEKQQRGILKFVL